jgi:DNA-binding PadR family transcriptional regulator
MTSKEFIIWLKGFITGSNNYNLTPSGWEALKSNLEQVEDDGINAIIDDGGISEYIRSKKTPPCAGHDNASWDEEDNKRMDIIGQNGNEGLHYENLEKLENDFFGEWEENNKIY